MHLSMRPGSRTGDVHWRSTTVSASILVRTSCNTERVVAVSEANAAGRSSTSAFHWLHTDAISGSSVDTTNRSRHSDSCAALMVQAMRGFPADRADIFFGNSFASATGRGYTEYHRFTSFLCSHGLRSTIVSICVSGIFTKIGRAIARLSRSSDWAKSVLRSFPAYRS